MSTTTTTTNIVVLGSGKVSRAITAWCSSQSIARTLRHGSGCEQKKPFSISVYTSCADTGSESLIEDMPWLSSSSSSSGGRSSAQIQRAANVSITADALTAAKKIAKADAVFLAAPATQAGLYLASDQRKPIRDALIEQQRSRQCPLFLFSRGVSLSSLTTVRATAPLPQSVTTSSRVVRSVASLQADEQDVVEALKGNEKQQQQRHHIVHCAANSLPDALSAIPIGGLLSHRCLLDAAAALVAAESDYMENCRNDDEGARPRLLHVRNSTVAALAVAPSMFTTHNLMSSSSSSSSAGAAHLARQLLDDIFGSGIVSELSPTTLHRSSPSSASSAAFSEIERHAILDACLAAAAFGCGLIKGMCAASLDPSARVHVSRRALDEFWGKLQRSNLVAACATTVDESFHSAVAHAALGTGGLTAVGNVTELGRRLGEHLCVNDAEASLFDVQNGGHAASLRRTLRALAELETRYHHHHNCHDDLSSNNVYSVLNEALTGYRSEHPSARWLAAPRVRPTAESSGSVEQQPQSRYDDSILETPHIMMDDIERLEAAMKTGVPMAPEEMAGRVKHVETSHSLSSALRNAPIPEV